MKVSQKNWQKWRERLLPIIRQTEYRNNHSFTEQIDEALLKERASLFCSEDGFFVLEPKASGEQISVIVLFAYCWADKGIESYQETIEQLSKYVGATSIELFTVIKQLSPVLIQQGYTRRQHPEPVQHWVKQI